MLAFAGGYKRQKGTFDAYQFYQIYTIGKQRSKWFSTWQRSGTPRFRHV
jgi:hypothetical protein